MLENVRFYKEETKNDPGYAEKLAKSADIYVNDAFGTAHRAHASTEGAPPGAAAAPGRAARPAAAGDASPALWRLAAGARCHRAVRAGAGAGGAAQQSSRQRTPAARPGTPGHAVSPARRGAARGVAVP